MNLNVLLETVRPTGLVSSDMILDAISAQNKSRDTELKYRGYLGTLGVHTDLSRSFDICKPFINDY